jgi:hypothetical protein
MRPSACLFLLCFLIAGCSSYVIFEKKESGASASAADWADCKRFAQLPDDGKTAIAGGATVDGARLKAEVVIPEQTINGMYAADDYLKIKRRQQLTEECMDAKGYRFVGVPSIERF